MPRLLNISWLLWFLSFVAPDTTDNCTNGEIELMGGDTEYEGRVEVCYDGIWGSLCPSSWDSNDAKVVCRQLGLITIG